MLHARCIVIPLCGRGDDRLRCSHLRARWNNKHNQTDSLLAAGASLACLHEFWLSALPYRGALANAWLLRQLQPLCAPQDGPRTRTLFAINGGSARSGMFCPRRRQPSEDGSADRVSPRVGGCNASRLEEVASCLGTGSIILRPDLAGINQAIEAIANPLRAAAESAKCSFSLEANEALLI